MPLAIILTYQKHLQEQGETIKISKALKPCWGIEGFFDLFEKDLRERLFLDVAD